MNANQILEKLGKVGGFAAGALSAMAVTFQEAVEKADAEGYKRGFADGERAAKEELAAFRRRLAGIIQEPEKPATQITAVMEAVEIKDSFEATIIRAPRGSVAPAVINALRSSQRGMSPKEVADIAAIPENSARGSLNKLRHDGVAEKRGPLWFLVRHKETAESVSADSAVSD